MVFRRRSRRHGQSQLGNSCVGTLPMHDEANPPADASDVAEQLVKELNERGYEYALGGAIALSYWAEPRGTMDVDLTLYLPMDKPSEIVWVLGEIGCDVRASAAIASIQEHSFCKVEYGGFRVDVFLPNIPFYEAAKARRQQLPIGKQRAMIWDAETLTVFKMMFFRRKDIADVEQILHSQRSFDQIWVREHLVDIYGMRDPRVVQWDELIREIQP
jgi:hypothetical protein